MTYLSRLRCMVPALATVLLFSTPSPAQDTLHYTIGTGSEGATFYPLMKTLCTRIEQKKVGFTCEAVSTPGSIYNLNAIANGEIALGLSQLALQYQSYWGLDPFQGENGRIATVAPLHQEVFILAVNPDSNIKSFADARRKRVNIGNQGSGSRVLIEQLIGYKGWQLEDFEIYSEKSSELPRLLCNAEIDAAIYSTGHPNAIYAKMIRECGVELIDLWDEDIARFVSENWRFVPAKIRANTYPSITSDKSGPGVQVVLSANKEISRHHIYQIVQTLVEDSEALARQAPVFGSIDATRYPLENVAPYHRGAQDYYQEIISHAVQQRATSGMIY
ncbi:MAG: TAXI family TRAP transporter solute-binding subunit [Halioglobus sp.]